MRITENQGGRLEGVPYIASPNYDVRPAGAVIDALVIHAISLPPGDYGSADIQQLFCNQLQNDSHSFYPEITGLMVSAHLLIRRDGQIIQFVSFDARAWHAGVSELRGRNRVNDFSIGIELEGSDYSPFEEAQYVALAEVSHALLAAYPQIARDRIVGHIDIAPQRKRDPGPYFNWLRYREDLVSAA